MLAKNSPTFGSQLIGEGERIVNWVLKKTSLSNQLLSKRSRVNESNWVHGRRISISYFRDKISITIVNSLNMPSARLIGTKIEIRTMDPSDRKIV
jgi:hypothetical protein